MKKDLPPPLLTKFIFLMFNTKRKLWTCIEKEIWILNIYDKNYKVILNQ